MGPLWLLTIGIVVVVGSILVLRLHAFLALIAAALVVAALTPRSAILHFALSEKKMAISEAEKVAKQSPGERVAGEFGVTCAKIGILIAMASIIGKCLLESGAADRIVRSMLALLGEKRAPAAFLLSGFFICIPVFFETVFFLMIPLGKATAARTRRNYALYVMTIIAGATMAHSLVPPTPGPLFVAKQFDVDLRIMMLGGIIVGLCASASGYLYAIWANRRWPVPLRDSADLSLAELNTMSQRDARELPPLWLSILPIVLPIVLIAGKLLDTNVALAIAAAIALLTLARQQRASAVKMTSAVTAALQSAGVVILIIAAGGAFGGVLQQTGIGARIKTLADTYRIAVLPLVFLVTTLIRTAQGSATVSIITSAGIFTEMAKAHQLGFHPLYLCLAIGCGSKPFPWMNDSGFWVISRMSGMSAGETLRYFSVMVTVMGIVGLVVTMLLARLFPMVG